jgi:hypothetical protein
MERLYKPEFHKYAIYRCDYRGKGGFWWFDDVMELKFFLTNVWPVYNYMSMICWTEETHVDFHNFESWYRYRSAMDDAVGQQIVHVTNGYFYGENHVVCWVGNLLELQQSMLPEPVAIRKSFHHNESEITADKQCDFIHHVSSRLEINGNDVLTFDAFAWMVRYFEKLQREKKSR